MMASPVETAGALMALYVSSGHSYFGRFGQKAAEFPMDARAELKCVAGRGVEGDRFFAYKPDYKGQITFFADEVYESLCRLYNRRDRSRSVFRRNVITRGIDLNGLIGRDFKIQGVVFRGIEECRPCAWMNEAFSPGTEDFLRGQGGLRATILTDGILRL